MTVEFKPETERLVQEKIRSGHVHSVDELIVFGVHALREKNHQAAHATETPLPRRRPAGKKSLVEVFAPLRGLDLDFSRNPSTGRPVDL